MERSLPEPSSIPVSVLDALAADADLPICTTCGTQYSNPRDDCPICEDPRQWVPEEGTTFTTLAKLNTTHKNTLLVDKDDPRITFIQTTPLFGIGQTRESAEEPDESEEPEEPVVPETRGGAWSGRAVGHQKSHYEHEAGDKDVEGGPKVKGKSAELLRTAILIETNGGSYVWDCCAFLSPPLAAYLLSLKKPLKGIAISHPHFFSTSLTWCRALGVPLYLNNADQDWYQRLDEVTPKDKIVWWRDRKVMGNGVEIVECGGHFSGSSILYWDRKREQEAPPGAPNWGVILTADTVAVQANRKGFTFMWSYPNMIPLEPRAVQRIQDILSRLDFDAASSAWPGRFIRRDAKRLFAQSVGHYLQHTGWDVDRGVLQPLPEAAPS